jgi:hypothetical protein
MGQAGQELAQLALADAKGLSGLQRPYGEINIPDPEPWDVPVYDLVEWQVKVVPEPATGLLLAFALSMLGACCRCGSRGQAGARLGNVLNAELK